MRLFDESIDQNTQIARKIGENVRKKLKNRKKAEPIWSRKPKSGWDDQKKKFVELGVQYLLTAKIWCSDLKTEGFGATFSKITWFFHSRWNESIEGREPESVR